MLRRVSIIHGCTWPLCFLFTVASELLRAVACINSAKLKRTRCDPRLRHPRFMVKRDNLSKMYWDGTKAGVESTVSSASHLCELLVSGFTLPEELLQRKSICISVRALWLYLQYIVDWPRSFIVFFSTWIETTLAYGWDLNDPEPLFFMNMIKLPLKNLKSHVEHCSKSIYEQ